MKCSELTLENAIWALDSFQPIKIIYNDEILYNDLDGDNIIEVLKDGSKVTGEMFSPKEIVPSRIINRENNIIISINIDIVDFHHSIITLKGE